MNCRVFYRISNESLNRPRLPGATKERCLDNFVEVFGPNIMLIADNCHEPLLRQLEKRRLKFLETNLGNSKSFLHTLDLACLLPEDTLVYFAEDDYLHLPRAPKLLEEGVSRAEYVTVYDHPDKYGTAYDSGEVAKVFRTENSHWRYTASTTMTFAAKVKTLREDKDVWRKWCDEKFPWPQDHMAFQELQNDKGRRLAVSMPGAACHTDLTYSIETNKDWIDPWATEMMLAKVKKTIFGQWDGEAEDAMVQLCNQDMPKIKLLTLLHQLEIYTLKKKKGG